MGKVILIHANCVNTSASGDFAFAGNIAKDLVRELATTSSAIDVILVSTLDGVSRFEKIYGSAVDGRIRVEGTSIGLSSLETFDAVEHTVVAFIDANRCKHAPADIVKRVLSPDSKFLFVGNVNQPDNSSIFAQTLYRMQVKRDQPGVYESFNDSDMLIGSAGLGTDRLGIPSIAKTSDLPPIPSSTFTMPTDNYGFMYVNAVNGSQDYKLMAQYMKLAGHDEYILVGDFLGKQKEIETAYTMDTTLTTLKKSPPTIQFHQSLPNLVMRKVVAGTTGSLVLSTGITSTLEPMQDGKLTYYQDLSCNTHFVAAYLIAVKSIVTSDSSLVGCMPQMLIELSTLLFADKPLSKVDMEHTQDLLRIDAVSLRLARINQDIVAQASGKIAPKLLGFLNSSRNTNDQIQLAHVCASLRKSGESGSPVHDQALRRAAAWGRLFELKVLIKSMTSDEINKKDGTVERTALHWAAQEKHLDCARTLVKAGASLDIKDKDGKTPLHKAVANGDRAMIKMLIEAGASVDIPDNGSKSPRDCAPDSGVSLFINHCHTQTSMTTISTTTL
ncbi:Dot/Icm T4SS effector AnkY/LegA9 [Legionella fallonii]|uniref:Ankyrin-repeat containing protein. Substrate of the Dot/Icm secretion system n=1 Tax=Legionella fallonii LLAP-10 TaxID=1212491 RepID=A0A098G0Q5_9GAMM|nr:Dot/Icm T4SS effector AnkY/LegA9 [Legionella fallonii]CEG55541.1 Ankyrin-repeat containing protein. Substrate of the Dot/Icm secretion system [Legionella fallonii LLAP-10]